MKTLPKKHADKNTIRLLDLMREKALSSTDVAAICGVSPLTVKAWISPESWKAYRRLPDRALRLLELTLQKAATGQN